MSTTSFDLNQPTITLTQEGRRVILMDDREQPRPARSAPARATDIDDLHDVVVMTPPGGSLEFRLAASAYPHSGGELTAQQANELNIARSLLFGAGKPWAEDMLSPGVHTYLERVSSKGAREGAILFIDRSFSQRGEPLVIIGDTATRKVGLPVNWNCLDMAELYSALSSRGFRRPMQEGMHFHAALNDPRAWMRWCDPFGFTPGVLCRAVADRQTMRAAVRTRVAQHHPMATS